MVVLVETGVEEYRTTTMMTGNCDKIANVEDPMRFLAIPVLVSLPVFLLSRDIVAGNIISTD